MKKALVVMVAVWIATVIALGGTALKYRASFMRSAKDFSNLYALAKQSTEHSKYFQDSYMRYVAIDKEWSSAHAQMGGVTSNLLEMAKIQAVAMARFGIQLSAADDKAVAVLRTTAAEKMDRVISAQMEINRLTQEQFEATRSFGE